MAFVGIASDQFRLGEPVLELAEQNFGIAAQEDGADTLISGRNQNRAK